MISTPGQGLHGVESSTHVDIWCWVQQSLEAANVTWEFTQFGRTVHAFTEPNLIGPSASANVSSPPAGFAELSCGINLLLQCASARVNHHIVSGHQLPCWTVGQLTHICQ